MTRTSEYDERAVNFDWRNWFPDPGDEVRFLTEEEMRDRCGCSKYYDVTPAAGWDYTMNRYFGLHVIIERKGSSIYPVEFAPADDMECPYQVYILVDGELDEEWTYSKDMFVPLSYLEEVRVSFRNFVKQTVDNVKKVDIR